MRHSSSFLALRPHHCPPTAHMGAANAAYIRIHAHLSLLESPSLAPPPTSPHPHPCHSCHDGKRLNRLP
eukprot:1142920-Pelagomonas_calceolata.AAC.1